MNDDCLDDDTKKFTVPVVFFHFCFLLGFFFGIFFNVVKYPHYTTAAIIYDFSFMQFGGKLMDMLYSNFLFYALK